MKKNSKKEEYSVKDLVLSEKNSPTFRERNYFEKLFCCIPLSFLVESKFSACFLGYGVFFTKQFVVFWSIFFCLEILFGNFATFNGKNSQIYEITKLKKKEKKKRKEKTLGLDSFLKPCAC
jgi:hypothetical protein